MAGTDRGPEVVCDAGPLIHLDEISALGLLRDFSSIIVPKAVHDEISHLRPQILHHHEAALTVLPADVKPDPAFAALVQALLLDAGEQEAILLARRRSAMLFTDDAAARLAAEGLGVQVHGTIGILIRAVRRGQRKPDEVLALLQRFPELSSLYLRTEFLSEIIQQFKSEFGL